MSDGIVNKIVKAAEERGLTLKVRDVQTGPYNDGKTSFYMKFDRPEWKKNEMATPFKEWFWKEYKGGTVVAERKTVIIKFIL